MNSSRRVSKPVLALVLACLCLTALVFWAGLRQRAAHSKSSDEASSVATQADSGVQTNSDETANDHPQLRVVAPSRPPLIVEGRVLDAMDRPIVGAAVWTSILEPQQKTRTDDAGEFQFHFGPNGGPVGIQVKAKGYLWANQMVLVEEGMDEVAFRLQVAKTIRGVVRNESSEPIPEARVWSSNPWDIGEMVEVTTVTDGHFEFETTSNSPRAIVQVACTGYEEKSYQRLDPDVENVIVLRRIRQVQGQVLDASTDRPIAKFQVGTGRRLPVSGSFLFPNARSLTEYTSPDGRFTVEPQDAEDNGIQVEADDYSAKIEAIPETTDRPIQMVFRLKASPVLEGIVVTSDGIPVAGATVASGQNQPGAGVIMSLSRGPIQKGWRTASLIVVITDEAGRFKLWSLPESGVLLANADSGFGMDTIERVRATGRLILKPFGRIEGTFTRGGQPVAGQMFQYQFLDANVSFDDGSALGVTDQEGRFIIERLPPGEGRLFRIFQPDSDSAISTIGGSMIAGRSSQCADVVIEPGRTTRLSIGETGATLKGHASFETPPAGAAKLSVSGSLFTPLPAFRSPDEERAYLESAEWKEARKHQRHFFVPVAEDGTYTVDLIPTGDYTLIVRASRRGQPVQSSDAIVAEGQVMVTVPENASPDAPIELGELVLKPVASPH